MEDYPKDWAHTAHCLTPLSVISLCLRLSIQPPHAIQMPSFSSSSVVRTADPSLLLEVTHFLVQNSPSETVHIVRGNIPENVNVILASDLVITLSGTLDRMKIRSTDIAISAVALHFKQYLETARRTDIYGALDIRANTTCVECRPTRPEYNLKHIYRRNRWSSEAYVVCPIRFDTCLHL